MQMYARLTLAALLGARALDAQQAASPSHTPSSQAASFCAASAESGAPVDSILRPPAPLVVTPQPVRGLYVNRWAAIGQKMWQLIDVAKSTEVNALAIDVKDDRGLVLYRSRVPLARE